MRALEPDSVGHSISHLLLNPPSGRRFSLTVRVPCGMECSPSHPSPYATPRPGVLGGQPILLTLNPLQGKLTTAVYRREGTRRGEVERGLSVMGQAPLGGFKAPPSPLGFKLSLVVPGRIVNIGAIDVYGYA